MVGRWMQTNKTHLYDYWTDPLMYIFGDAGTQELYSAEDPNIHQMLATPAFRRAYLRGFRDMLEGPFQRYAGYMDDLANAAAENGVAVNTVQVQAAHSFIASRTVQLGTVLAGCAASFAIANNDGQDFSTTTSAVILEGTAPIGAALLYMNGQKVSNVTWTGVTTWQIPVALNPGQNAISITGHDADGNLIPEYSDTITIAFNP